LTKGTLDAAQITILAPAIFLMGSQLQYMGRLLGVADVPKKYWPLLMLTSILNSIIAMIVMRVIS
jgi:spore maturation protein SpmB